MILRGWPFEPLGGNIELDGEKPPGGGAVPS